MRSGNDFGRQRSSIREFVVAATLDLRTAFECMWQNLPNDAVACFWRSWQVHNYLADLCERLIHSRGAQKSAVANRLTVPERAAFHELALRQTKHALASIEPLDADVADVRATEPAEIADKPITNGEQDNRREDIRAYKKECKAAGVKVTDSDIAHAADPNWNDRTVIQKWITGTDPRYTTRQVSEKIRMVLRTKPHIVGIQK